MRALLLCAILVIVAVAPATAAPAGSSPASTPARAFPACSGAGMTGGCTDYELVTWCLSHFPATGAVIIVLDGFKCVPFGFLIHVP